jgi:hypothetical protein
MSTHHLLARRWRFVQLLRGPEHAGFIHMAPPGMLDLTTLAKVQPTTGQVQWLDESEGRCRIWLPTPSKKGLMPFYWDVLAVLELELRLACCIRYPKQKHYRHLFTFEWVPLEGAAESPGEQQ